MPELAISPEKVAWVIVRSRELTAKVAPYDTDTDPETDEQQTAILEDRPGDATRQELVAFINGLNEDERANLIAMAWIGRETYTMDDWESAVETARREHRTNAAQYLLGLPLLPDFLEDALDAFGYSTAELEESFS